MSVIMVFESIVLTDHQVNIHTDTLNESGFVESKFLKINVGKYY